MAATQQTLELRTASEPPLSGAFGWASGHQSQLHPKDNKFHQGNGDDGKHYWLTPPDLYAQLNAEFGPFDFDPCPYPKPADFDGLTCEWGQRNYVNPPFGSIIHNGKKKGPTAWMRKAIEEQKKGKLSVVVYPVDKWVLMMLAATGATNIRNLGDVRWHATEDGSQGKGTGRHIAAFVLYPDIESHLRFLLSEVLETQNITNACRNDITAALCAPNSGNQP